MSNYSSSVKKVDTNINLNIDNTPITFSFDTYNSQEEIIDYNSFEENVSNIENDVNKNNIENTDSVVDLAAFEEELSKIDNTIDEEISDISNRFSDPEGYIESLIDETEILENTNTPSVSHNSNDNSSKKDEKKKKKNNTNNAQSAPTSVVASNEVAGAAIFASFMKIYSNTLSTISKDATKNEIKNKLRPDGEKTAFEEYSTPIIDEQYPKANFYYADMKLKERMGMDVKEYIKQLYNDFKRSNLSRKLSDEFYTKGFTLSKIQSDIDELDKIYKTLDPNSQEAKDIVKQINEKFRIKNMIKDDMEGEVKNEPEMIGNTSKGDLQEYVAESISTSVISFIISSGVSLATGSYTAIVENFDELKAGDINFFQYVISIIKGGFSQAIDEAAGNGVKAGSLGIGTFLGSWMFNNKKAGSATGVVFSNLAYLVYSMFTSDDPMETFKETGASTIVSTTFAAGFTFIPGISANTGSIVGRDIVDIKNMINKGYADPSKVGSMILELTGAVVGDLTDKGTGITSVLFSVLGSSIGNGIGGFTGNMGEGYYDWIHGDALEFTDKLYDWVHQEELTGVKRAGWFHGGGREVGEIFYDALHKDESENI